MTRFVCGKCGHTWLDENEKQLGATLTLPANCPNCKGKIVGSRPLREVFVEKSGG
jgi:DNA-directed RNA polymerase subunit RPC12/RpoP